MEIEKIEEKLLKIDNTVKQNLVNYNKTKNEKWKKEAKIGIKKKNFYNDYLNKLKKNKYEKEMKNLQEDIDKSKKEFVRIT